MAVGMTEVVAMVEVGKRINKNDTADEEREHTNGRQKSTKASARGVMSRTSSSLIDIDLCGRPNTKEKSKQRPTQEAMRKSQKRNKETKGNLKTSLAPSTKLCSGQRRHS